MQHQVHLSLSAPKSFKMASICKASTQLSRRRVSPPDLIAPASALPKGPVDALAERIEDPILRTAVKEPVAFWGGMFAGALGLNLNEEPLKSFLERSSCQAQHLDTFSAMHTY